MDRHSYITIMTSGCLIALTGLGALVGVPGCMRAGFFLTKSVVNEPILIFIRKTGKTRALGVPLPLQCALESSVGCQELH